MIPENKIRLLRITTVPISLKYLLKGQLLFMQQHGFEVLAVSADGKEREQVMKAENVEHIVVPMSRVISPFQDLICLFKLISVIIKFKPSIVHTHTPKAGLLGMMAAYICKVPLRLHTVAGLPLMETTGLKRKLLMFTERVTYYCAHRVYPNSFGLCEFILNAFRYPVSGGQLPVSSFQFPVSGDRLPVTGDRRPATDIHHPVSKFRVIGRGSSNGIDTTYFSRTNDVVDQVNKLRQQFGNDESTITFSFVGRVVKDKGIEELLIAFDRLSQVKKAMLIIVGSFEDDLDPITERSKAILKGNTNIVLAGFQNDVRPYIAASDIFVFPSYREGFPNVVMQACSLGVPCIVSDINGCNEIIQHHETGLIVKSKDVDALYDAMMMLADDKSKQHTFGGAARKFVVANFEQQYVWGELVGEYRAVASLL